MRAAKHEHETGNAVGTENGSHCLPAGHGRKIKTQSELDIRDISHGIGEKCAWRLKRLGRVLL